MTRQSFIDEFLDLECIAGTEEADLSKFFQSFATYLMIRKEEVMFIDQTENVSANY